MVASDENREVESRVDESRAREGWKVSDENRNVESREDESRAREGWIVSDESKEVESREDESRASNFRAWVEIVMTSCHKF